ncbi:MAG: DEAD/DEAH box helicase [Clostridiaceae bacterium]
MFHIDKGVIKRAAGDLIYARGVRCYNNNSISSIEGEIVKRWGNTALEINSKVLSSNGLKEYDTHVEIINGSNYFTCGCDCIYVGKVCKHIVSVMLYFIDNKEKILKSYEMKKSEEILKDIKKSFLEDRDVINKKYLNTSYKLDFSMGYGGFVTFEMKVGESKEYVVKNIRELIEGLKFEKEIYFGKGFTLKPDIHSFRKEDEEIINLLMDIYENDNMIQNISHYTDNSAKIIRGKKVYLTENNLEKILNILKNRTIGLTINDNDLGEVPIVNEDFFIDFSLKLEDDNVFIKQVSELPTSLSKSSNYFFYEGKIYIPSESWVRAYRVLFNAFINEKTMEISFKEDYNEEIASYVLPLLNKIGRKVDVEEKFKDRFYQEPLKTSIYFDKNEKEILCTIIFKYGEIEINPLVREERGKEKILVRNIDEENKIINILENFSFGSGKENYFLANEDEILDFMLKGMELLQELGEVYYSEEFKNMRIYSSSNYKSTIRLNEENLLEFTFDIEGIDKSELKDIFQSLKEKKKYHRLKKGGFISLLENNLHQVLNLMENLDIKGSQLEKDKILLSKYQSVYLDSSIKDNKLDFVERNKPFKELVNSIKDIGDIDIQVPNSLKEIMRTYQRFGFKWFKTLSSCGFGGILADEMGLGKTLQTLAFIKSQVEENLEDRCPSIVICPTSLVYNWVDEVNKFVPELKYVVVSGSKEEREKNIENIKGADLVITSYALIRRDFEDYRHIKFSQCFLDEAQNIKNPQSLNAQAVKSIRADHCFALTGTPIENSLTELWSIFDFIMPGYLFTHRKFSQKYEMPIVKNKDEKALIELNRRIKPFILRRLKKDVVKELPPKIEHNVIVDMEDEQKKIYASFAAQAKKEFSEEIKVNGFNKSRIKILSLITRLRQICCDPSTFIENYNGGSGKMEALLNIVENSIEEGHRILIFSQFTSVLKNISEKFKENSIGHLYLDGSIKSEIRGALVKDFNEGKVPIFLISLKAGGTGLNLTSADIVIHFDPWWNPAVEEQASDRAHRIGQKKTVEVIRLIAKGSIEEKIYKIQEKKRGIIGKVMDENSGEEILISNMGQQEIEEIFAL